MKEESGGCEGNLRGYRVVKELNFTKIQSVRPEDEKQQFLSPIPTFMDRYHQAIFVEL